MHALETAWVVIIAFGVLMYVILDGFDLGIGIIAPFFPQKERDIMISTILPVWDGNETWLVLGGAMLYGAFPLAFSLILPTLYLPVLLMVCALLFRGVSFEFRMKSDTEKKFWDVMFSFGSIVATLMQGLVLGTFIQGFNVTTTDVQQLVVPGYAWLTPFSLTCAVALLFGYGLLGSTWLISKTKNLLQQDCYKAAKICFIFVALFAIAISIWTPFVDPHIKARWFTLENFKRLAILPAFGILAWAWGTRGVIKQKERSPFWGAVAIFLSCYLGFIISSYPYIVPHQIPYWKAAAPKPSLEFMLVGALIMLPVLLYYTYHSYRIFKGKVDSAIHY